MLRRTHLAVGLCSTAIFIKEPKDIFIVGLFTAIGSLIPDIDAPAASIVKRFKYITLVVTISLIYIYFTDNIIPFVFLAILVIYGTCAKHRTFTHSPLGLLAFSLCIYFIEPMAGVYFFIGYVLHLFADSLTPMGVPLLYPFIKKYYSLNKLKTGSNDDKMIGYMCLLGYIYFFTLL